jgi:putative intracellular protease/amidase
VHRNLAALVFTSVESLSNGCRAGYWLAEAAYPWLALARAGWPVVAISTLGVKPTPGGIDQSDRTQREFLADQQIARRLAQARPAGFYQPDDFGVVCYAGGVGAVIDIPLDVTLTDFAGQVVAGGGVLAACGYGVAGLLNIAPPGSQSLVQGRSMTTMSLAEETILDLPPLPFSLAGELARRGARCTFRDPFRPHVVTDGSVICGQNPGSAREMARKIVTAIA